METTGASDCSLDSLGLCDRLPVRCSWGGFNFSGDTLAVVLGYETTLPVTLEEMLHHAASVRRGVNGH
jgi:hypothetical protein